MNEGAASEEVARMVFAFGDAGRKQAVRDLAARVRRLEAVADAARAFFSQPYDNGQWERRLRDAVDAMPPSSSATESK